MNNLAVATDELQTRAACPIPDNETARLAALHALHILDTSPDDRFDRITRIATALFNMPIVRITFVDENRTWFKSCTGLSVHEAPREISICSHTIMGTQPLVVRNLELDPRFRDSPQVKGKLALRFYAGAPITMEGGCHVGAVCLMDTVPHPEFSDQSIALLQDLANVVVDELNVHKQIFESEAVLQKAVHGLQAKDRELLEVNERLSEAQRIAKLGSWSLDIRSDRWEWSPSLHGIFGLAEGQVAPSLEALLRCIHPDDVEIVRAALERSVKGEPHNVYCRGALPGGRNIYLHVYGETTTDYAGAPSTVSGTIHDITDQKIAELQITEHKNELESLVAERTEELQAALKRETEYNILQQKFVSLVSHEFRTPLAIIDAVSQGLVRRKSETSPEVLREKVEKIRVSVKRLIELIDMTLYLSRFDAGSIQMDLKACNLGHLLQQVGKMQSEIHASHQIEIDVDALPGQIEADERLLNLVFTNLLSNAVKYSPSGAKVSVRGTVEGDCAVVTVCDEGIGISKADLPNMFGRFFRASTAKGIRGTGIGLYISKEFVEMHGGKIEVASVEGEGSTFTVALPIRAAA